MEELIEKLKAQLIDALNLEEVKPEDIDPEAPLFGDEGLGLDSIDALEIILLLDKEYGIKLKNPAEGKQVFHSVKTMADYITANRKYYVRAGDICQWRGSRFCCRNFDRMREELCVFRHLASWCGKAIRNFSWTACG